MTEIYTSGSLGREGREEQEFIDAWRDLAEWTKGEIAGAGNPRLLRDRDNTRRFLSSAAREIRQFLRQRGRLRLSRSGSGLVWLGVGLLANSGSHGALYAGSDECDRRRSL